MERKLKKSEKTVNHAIEVTCNIALDRTHTPRALFVRTVTVFLCCAHDKDWDLKEEMQMKIELQSSLRNMRRHRAFRQTTEVN